MFVKTIEWLLQDTNPSVKYWTLRDLLGNPDDDLQIQKARKRIAQQDAVEKILSQQHEQGFWGNSQKLWGYDNTGFQLLLLSELGLERNSRIEKAVKHVLSFQQEDGSFGSVLKKKKEASTNEFCLTGIILRILLLFGYENSGVHDAVDFLVSAEENGWSCSWYPSEKDKVFPERCYMGGVKVLSAFAKLPSHLVTAGVKDIIERNAEIYLENRIYWYRKDKSGKRAKKPSWTKFAFPLFWQSDVLEVLEVLTELGIVDERMHEALNLVKSKNIEGKWILERTHPRGMEMFEKVGHPSKWITLRALRVLKRAGCIDLG